ncbi:MAG: sulfotransferase domain-containing protein [Bacteroidota bacterium]
MRIIDRIIHKIHRNFDDIILSRIKLKTNVEKSLIISGDPRGGTTWLSEIIMENPNTALVWEPLSIPLIPDLNKLNFSHRQYIPENDNWSEAKSYFTKVLSGNAFNHHLLQKQSYKNLLNPNQTHVKLCRANQLLPWLTNQFQFKYAPIYLVRHPCAVVASQLKQGGWDHVSDKFHIPYEKPYPEFYSQHEDFLKSIDSKVKVLAATWCLCNSVPLNHQENNKNWITITYESLVMDGVKQIERIEKRWGIKFPETSYQKLQKASATTVKGSPILERNGSQLEYWEKQLSQKDIQDIFEVINYFDIQIYDRNPMPKFTYIS